MHCISNSHQRPVVADLHQPVKLQFPATLARMSQIVDLVTSAVTASRLTERNKTDSPHQTKCACGLMTNVIRRKQGKMNVFDSCQSRTDCSYFSYSNLSFTLKVKIIIIGSSCWFRLKGLHCSAVGSHSVQRDTRSLRRGVLIYSVPSGLATPVVARLR